MAEKVIEDLQCPVCMERFNKPRILPCGHSFCEACLKKYINKKARAAKSKGFPCIVCREPATPVEKDKPVSQWASLFPLNFSLASLAISIESTNTNQPRCKSCQDEGKTIQGTRFCIECQEYMCNVCKAWHEKTLISRDHILVSCEKEGFDPKEFSAFETNCSCNGKKELSVYCQTHDQVCCNNCAESEHGYCLQTFPIDELNKEIKKQNMRNRAHISIKQLQDFFKDEIRSAKEKAGQIQLQKDDIVKTIKGTLRELTDMINRLDDNMTLTVTRLTDAEINTLNERTSTLEEILSELSNISSKGTSNTFDFLTYRKFERVFRKCREFYGEKADIPTACSLTYTTSEKVQTLKQEINTLGNLRVNRTTSDQLQNYPLADRLTLDLPPGITCQTRFIDSKIHITTKSPVLGLPSYRFPSPVKLRLKRIQYRYLPLLLRREIDDDGGPLRGLAFFPDSSSPQQNSWLWLWLRFCYGCRSVYIFDGVENNVQMLDSRGHLICSCYVEQAWDTTVLGEERVAVAQGRKEQIQILTIEISGFLMTNMTFKPLTVIRTNGKCFGISYHGGHIFAAVNRKTCKASIQIMDLTGEVKEVIWLTTGLSMFLTIDVSDSNTIYMTGKEGKIFSVTRQGTLRILHGKVRARCSITTDRHGNVYACDKGNLGMGGCIVRMSPDGENVKIVLSENETSATPYSIWYNTQSDSFLVAQYLPNKSGPDNAFLAEYNLCNA